MFRRFASVCLSVLMLAALTGQGVPAVIAANPAPADHLVATNAPADVTQTTAPIAAASDCLFCVLVNEGLHALLLDNGANLRVDGSIVVNQPNWDEGPSAIVECGQSPCTAAICHPPYTFNVVMVCGDAIDLLQTGGADHTAVSARTISVAGGWETHGGNVMKADGLPDGCVYHPEPPAYAGFVVANVCIGTAQIADPLNDPADPGHMVAPPDPFALSTCPGEPVPCGPVPSPSCTAQPGTTLLLPTGTSGEPATLTIHSTGVYTICPGLYFGGLSAFGDFAGQPRVIMLPGTYDMVGGDFTVLGLASITSVSSQGDGVMIFESDGRVRLSTVAGPPCAAEVAPCGQVVLHAPSSGPYARLLFFVDRTVGHDITVRPALGAPACTGTWMTDGVPPDTQPVPEPCGPLGGLTGTIYAPHQSNGSPTDFDAIVRIDASGLADLRVIAAKVYLLRPDTQSRFTHGPVDHLVITPSPSTISAGASQAYSVEAFDADGHSLGDVTGSSTFDIAPDGSCTGASCSATVSGPHTVTATHEGVTATATLTVTPGPLDHLALIPANASIAAGGIQAYAADGRDAFDNSLGTVSGVTFRISPNGSCSYGKCTATIAGVHTVTGSKSGMSASTTLTVTPGPLDHLVLGSATKSVLAGVAQPYTAQGRDRFNNSLGDVTAGTVFTIAPNGSCSGASCIATTVGNHTVTGVNAGKSGKAVLTVKAGPLDHLALVPVSATIVPGGSRAYSATGRDAFNNPLGTVSGVVYTIGPDGSCNHNVCTATAVGPHTVTGAKGGVTGTATLIVTSPAHR